MNKAKVSKPIQKSKPVKSQSKIAYSILLIAYLLLPVFIPRFSGIDANGPKFFAIAVLNLISLFVLFIDSDFKQQFYLRLGFFRNYIGIAYMMFLLMSLLSFSQSINLSESVLNFVKIFTVFTSTFMLYVILSSDKRYFSFVTVTLALLLVFDSFSVFYQILNYVSGKIDSLFDIKTFYSNKNILAASLFIKLPIALWLIVFNKDRLRFLGYFAAFTSILAILFTSARAFYLGLILLLVALALFFMMRRFSLKTKLSFKKVLLFTGSLVFAMVLFSLVQRFLYPTILDPVLKQKTGLIDRLTSINAGESSTNARLTTWKMSFWLMRENPLLGVGIGNWKIRVLKYEAPMKGNFIVSYKNHNDFIEITAETGPLGGLAYLSIFILIIMNFIKKGMNPEADEETMKFLFLPAFGILAYSVDAFLNFPIDRPDIQSLFAVYVAMGIAFSGNQFSVFDKSVNKQPLSQKPLQKHYILFSFFFSFLLICASIIVLSMNVKSLQLQSIVYDDEKHNTYSYPSSFFIEEFPSIPNLSWCGAPINTYLARYLINEKRGREAVNLLSKQNPSPWDGRREYNLSRAYDLIGKNDSVIYWAQKVYTLKPLYTNMILILNAKLFMTGKQQEACDNMDNYLAKVKTKTETWLLAADLNMKIGNEKKALLLLDSAMKYLPGNDSIVDKRKSIQSSLSNKPYEELYNQAKQAISASKYSEALKLLNNIISNKPDFIGPYQNRAISYHYLGEYSKSLEDLEKVFNSGQGDMAFFINLRGANYLALGRLEEACIDFKISMEKGNANGETNYHKFCESKEENKQQTIK